MSLSVYYDEIDGKLHPQWLLLPVVTDKQYVTYSIEAPFQRFYSEDFHESLKLITVTQAALVKDPFNPNCFSVHMPQIINDLDVTPIGNLDEADFFIVQMSDLEEVLQMSVYERFIV